MGQGHQFLGQRHLCLLHQGGQKGLAHPGSDFPGLQCGVQLDQVHFTVGDGPFPGAFAPQFKGLRQHQRVLGCREPLRLTGTGKVLEFEIQFGVQAPRNLLGTGHRLGRGRPEAVQPGVVLQGQIDGLGQVQRLSPQIRYRRRFGRPGAGRCQKQDNQETSALSAAGFYPFDIHLFTSKM